MLADLPRPIPVCADESCFDRASLAGLQGKYDVVNLKLDKTGGLTEGLLTRDLARAMGFGLVAGHGPGGPSGAGGGLDRP